MDNGQVGVSHLFQSFETLSNAFQALVQNSTSTTDSAPSLSTLISPFQMMNVISSIAAASGMDTWSGQRPKEAFSPTMNQATKSSSLDFINTGSVGSKQEQFSVPVVS